MLVAIIGIPPAESALMETVLAEPTVQTRHIAAVDQNPLDLLNGPALLDSDIDLIFLSEHLMPRDQKKGVEKIKQLSKMTGAILVIVTEFTPSPAAEAVVEQGLAEIVSRPLKKVELTARFKSCQALQRERRQHAASKKWFLRVVESMPIVFAEYEEPYNVCFANRLGAEIWGVPHEQIVNPPDKWIDYIHANDKQRVVDAIKNIKSKPLNVQYRIVRPDGQIRWIDDSFIPVLDHAGRRLKLFGFGRDITKRKLAEHSLHRSNAHLKSLMQTANGFALYRLAFDKGDPLRWNVVFVSPSIMDIIGVTEPDLDALLKMIHPEDIKKIQKIIVSCPLPSRMDETLRVFHPQHQHWRWIQVLANQLFDEQGRLQYSNGIIFDVTDQVSATMALKQKDTQLAAQTQKLQKLNDALSVLLEHREKKLETLRLNMWETLEKLVFPYLQDLAMSHLQEDQKTLLEIIHNHLADISSSFTRTLSTWKEKLSPTEIRVADLVKNGKTTKEISALLKVSPAAISFHRANIRNKLGIANRKVNLVRYLESLGCK